MNNSKTLELGTKPIGELLMQFAVPAIIAMVASSLYNLVDRIFIGQGVGPMAISGLAITFPFINLSAAFGAAVGVGASTLISVNLGKKEYGTAQRIFGNTITLNVILGIAFAVVCLLFLDPLLTLFGATEQTLPYAREYMVVILVGNVFSHMYFGMNAILRAASKPKLAMGATIFTVVLNTLLDPLFIYTFKMGIAGAAYATIISQTIALVWQFKIFSDKKELLHLQRSTLPLDFKLVREILGIGISPFLMNACSCLVVIFINNSLVKYGGDYAVGAYGIDNSIVFIFFMIIMGLNQGMQPIAGYNYGSKQYDRLRRVMTLTTMWAVGVSIVGWLVCQFAPHICVGLFTTDSELTAIAIRGLRINAMLLPLIGYQIVIVNFFQSIGKVKISIFLSLSRQLIFLIPLMLILSGMYGVDGVWASLPASDLLAAIVAAVFMYIYIRKFKMMEAEEDAHKMNNMRNYHFYPHNDGAAPRGMAPQAKGSLYEKGKSEE